jgi:hypothetical protein
MKLNPDCMRVVLKYCVENIDYQEINLGGWFEKTVTLQMLYEDKEFSKFMKKDIMYSVMKLCEYNYITLSQVYPNGGKKYIDNCIITDVTMHGHNFYESIQEDTIWNKTKHIIGSVGNHTLKFIEDTAQKVATESAKQAITIMITQK